MDCVLQVQLPVLHPSHVQVEVYVARRENVYRLLHFVLFKQLVHLVLHVVKMVCADLVVYLWSPTYPVHKIDQYNVQSQPRGNYVCLTCNSVHRHLCAMVCAALTGAVWTSCLLVHLLQVSVLSPAQIVNLVQMEVT